MGNSIRRVTRDVLERAKREGVSVQYVLAMQAGIGVMRELHPTAENIIDHAIERLRSSGVLKPWTPEADAAFRARRKETKA